MNEKQLRKILNKKEVLNKRIEGYLKHKILVKQEVDSKEISGHIAKAEHNAEFVKDTLERGYSDWAVVGCYYAAYHMALALILKKGFSSKNHDATLCILIKEYYDKELSGSDIELLNKVYLNNEDILFYVKSKEEREKASYSSQIVFDKRNVEDLRMKTLEFVRKAREILNNAIK